MFKIIGLALICLVLPACGTTPESAAEAQAATGVDASEAGATDSGLGTVAFDERTRKQTCKKERIPGSRMTRSTCDDSPSGSYSVKDGNWATLGQYQVGETTEPR